MGILAVASTPVQRAESVSRALGREVWVKRDDLTHPRYGGNKVRKLAHILADARARGATDLLTLGAVGSHHVLATAVHGGALGFAVHAVLVPQPRTDHVAEVARADLSQHARLIPAAGPWQVPALLAGAWLGLRARGRRPYFITAGGSSALGSVGYVDGVRELSEQLARGEAPAPDEIVCALGSGGTHAGILAGARALGLGVRVVGVRVTARWMVARGTVARLARGALRLSGLAGGGAAIGAGDVLVEESQLGGGYGVGTDAARKAAELFAGDGVVLDPTYTAKAAAGLIARARAGAPGARYLFWHTLSSAPMGPLLEQAPAELPARVARLMR